MARTEIWINCELTQPAVVLYPNGRLFQGDAYGNVIGIHVYSDKQPVNLTGSIIGICYLANGASVPVSGSISGNSAYVVLTDACYAVPGPVIIVIKNVNESITATLGAVVTTVFGTGDASVAPSQTTINAWLAMIQTAINNVEGSSIRYDISQSLTDAQKTQALSNLGKIYDVVQFPDDDYVIILP